MILLFKIWQKPLANNINFVVCGFAEMKRKKKKKFYINIFQTPNSFICFVFFEEYDTIMRRYWYLIWKFLKFSKSNILQTFSWVSLEAKEKLVAIALAIHMVFNEKKFEKKDIYWIKSKYTVDKIIKGTILKKIIVSFIVHFCLG